MGGSSTCEGDRRSGRREFCLDLVDWEKWSGSGKGESTAESMSRRVAERVSRAISSLCWEEIGLWWACGTEAGVGLPGSDVNGLAWKVDSARNIFWRVALRLRK